MNTNYLYEKLGLFYLGRELDLESGEPLSVPFLLKNKSLTTHAAIIGMTGSGKTGLGIGLIEEAIMDNIPSIIIDPKGDMGNLLLTFPNLLPEDFSPWIDPSEAARREMSSEQYAEEMAKTWEEGLASWGQGKDRIRSLKEKTSFSIYTPGSSAGMPISVVNDFHAPSQEIVNDLDMFNSMVSSTTVSLLSLVDIKGDALKSREHILISSLLLHFWRRGEDMDLERLIGHIVNPPFDKVGVFGLDIFFPQRDRMELAMRLNNVLASPIFAAWMQGDPLDIQKILYTEDGKPKTSIFSIAHLNDSERMFFVTMLLNQFIGWMRRQQGTSSLKALLYMDEIAGYFPPSANPPSKKPMLLLLKQARAYGVGVILATQNPVDLDYKGLSNIGSWFIGRLQTSQDQRRVVDGIVGASEGNLDVKKTEQLLFDMKGRQFLLRSAHLDEPLLFETRWVLSYLKGPISTGDISKLMNLEKGKMPKARTEIETERVSNVHGELSELPPPLSSGIPQLFYLHSVQTEKVRFEPWLLAQCSVRFFNSRRNIDIVKDLSLRIYLDEKYVSPNWKESEVWAFEEEEYMQQPPTCSSFYPLAPSFAKNKDLRGCSRGFAEYVYQSERLELKKITSLKLESLPNESLKDFRIRVSDYLRDKRAEEVEKLRGKYRSKQERLEKQVQRALHKIEKEKSDVKSKTTDTVLSFGMAVLGAFLGRKAISSSTLSRASSGVRHAGRIAKEKEEVKRAEESLALLQGNMENLVMEVEVKVSEVMDKYQLENFKIESFYIKPRRSDIFNLQLALLWEMVPEISSPNIS